MTLRVNWSEVNILWKSVPVDSLGYLQKISVVYTKCTSVVFKTNAVLKLNSHCTAKLITFFKQELSPMTLETCVLCQSLLNKGKVVL